MCAGGGGGGRAAGARYGVAIGPAGYGLEDPKSSGERSEVTYAAPHPPPQAIGGGGGAAHGEAAPPPQPPPRPRPPSPGRQAEEVETRRATMAKWAI